MADEFKILLGVELKSDAASNLNSQIKALQLDKIEVKIDDQNFNKQLGTIKTAINNIQPNPFTLRMDDRKVLSQLTNIKQQIQQLGNIRINLGGGNTSTGINNTVDAFRRATRDTANLYKQIIGIEMKLNKLKMSGADAGNIAQYTNQLNQLMSIHQRLEHDLSGQNIDFNVVFDGIDKGRTELAQLSSEVDNARTRLAKDIAIRINRGDLVKDAKNVEDSLSKIVNQTNETRQAYAAFQTALNNLNIANQSKDVEELTRRNNEYVDALRRVKNQIDINAALQKQHIDDQMSNTRRDNLLFDIDIWSREHSAAMNQFGSRIEDLKSKIRSVNDIELSGLEGEWRKLTKEANLAGKATKTLGDRLKDQFKQYSAYFSVAEVFSYVSQAMRSMYDNVIKVDTAMTNLYKVTDGTQSRYEQFLKSAAKNSQDVSRSMSSYIEQTANWAKMDYSIDESEQLAKLSSIYANVADVDDTTAVSDMVTAMKAFNIEASKAITIIDPINKLSNEFAVSAAGLGQGLSRAASTMSTAGTDLEHTLALLTGISEITQSPDEAGNFLKTAIARIQGMKGKLEELGEEIDDRYDSISKVQTQILNLTRNTSKPVNIFDDNGEFRDYYYIMQDIASIVDELKSTDRAQLYEILFGKNRMNQGAAMIQAFQTGQIDKALKAAKDAEGSAYKEQEKYAESLKARLKELESAWESLSNTFLSSDFLKGAIDALTNFVNFLDMVIDKIGTLNTIIAGIAMWKGISGLASTIKAFGGLSSAIGQVKSLGDAITLLGTNASGTNNVLGTFMSLISKHPKIAIAVGAVTLLVTAFDKLYTSAKEANEKMGTAFTE
jgi:TP901 family phage tail tape measure protein